jgi:nucleotide-binding universal stress UspA family protein
MRWTRIMVPLDGSGFAREALPAAEHLARRDGARLRLVTVHPGLPPGPGGTVPEELARADREQRASRGEALEELAGELRGRGLEVDAEVLSGPVVEELARRAGEAADLVVMATHGRGPLSRLWLGSVADGLVRNCPVPVLLVRPRDDGDREAPGSGGFRHALVPLDGSRLARRAVGPAARLLERPGGALTLLRVVVPVTPSGLGPADVPSGVDVSATEAMEEQAEERLEATARELRERLDLEVRSRVVRDPHPAAAVLRAASDAEADAVALATHGRGGLRRVLLGSVADKVVRGARTPVLVVRPGDDG